MKTIGILDKNKFWMDNSAISLFKTCPRKYFLRIEQAICQATPGPALSTGSAVHDCKDIYLKAKIAGHRHEECKEIALYSLSKAMLAIPNPDELRNETVLVKIMDRYFDRWKDEIYTCIDTEVGFAVDLEDFIYVGKIDAIKTHPAFGLLVEETKTTTIVGNRWDLRTKPNCQIDGYVSSYYILTGEMPYGAILDVIPVYDETKTREKGQAAVDKKVKANEAFRLITSRSKQDVDNWITTTKEWFSHIIRMKETKVWPMNTDACAPLVGYTCEYIPICSEHPNVSDVHAMNISSIYKVEEWEPWEISEKKGETTDAKV